MDMSSLASAEAQAANKIVPSNGMVDVSMWRRMDCQLWLSAQF